MKNPLHLMKKIKLISKLDNYINDKKFSIIYKNNNLDIINYTKIVDFSSTLISISNQNNLYIIEGENLVISKMFEEEILITGKITKITFS